MMSDDMTPGTYDMNMQGGDSAASTQDLGRGDPWRPVRTRLTGAVSSDEILGFQFIVRDGSDHPSIHIGGGAYSIGDRIPYDSAIKPVTSLVVLALDDSLADVLGWQGVEGSITIEQLLTFSSGFDGNTLCLTFPPSLDRSGGLNTPRNRFNLAECAERVREDGVISTPGTAFTYGANHHMILAHVAEEVTETSWDTLFEELVRAPLGLTREDIAYVNNRVAASAVGDAHALNTIFEAVAADAGIIDAPRGLLGPDLTEAFLIDRIRADAITIADSPWQSIDEEIHFASAYGSIAQITINPAHASILARGPMARRRGLIPKEDTSPPWCSINRLLKAIKLATR